jgi:hypothetical protein
MRSLHACARPASRGCAALAAALALLAVPSPAAAQDATSTAIDPTAGTVQYRHPIAFVAHVTDSADATKVPVGQVQFQLDGQPFGGLVDVGPDGSASTGSPGLTVGHHTVDAAFTPTDGTAFAASTAPQQGLDVVRAVTAPTLQITPTHGVAGQDLDALVTVASDLPAQTGPPTGSVTYSVASAALGTDTLGPDGTARGFLELRAGQRTVTVAYGGSANFAPSQATATVTIDKAGTVISLTASPNPAAVGQGVHFETSIDSLAPSTWWPSGTLWTTLDSTPIFGPIPVTGGELFGVDAAFPVAGTFTVSEHFAGDADFRDSDVSLPVTITGPAATTPPAATKPPTTGAPIVAASARGLKLKVTPKRDRKKPYKFTASASLVLPAGVSRADGCKGTVTVDARIAGRRVARKTATVTGTCAFAAKLTIPRKGRVAVSAAFGGNARVAKVTAGKVTVRAG